MKLKSLPVLVAVLIPLAAWGQEKQFDKLLDYKSVTVKKVEPDGIRIMHSSGAASIPIERLPEDVRKELGMTMEAAAEHRKKLAAEKEAAAKEDPQLRPNRKALKATRFDFVDAEVYRLEKEGVLAHLSEAWDGETYQKTRPGKPKVKATHVYDKPTLVFIRCNPEEYEEGDPFEGTVWFLGRYIYMTQPLRMFTMAPEEVLEVSEELPHIKELGVLLSL